jgi:hypothetical protein
MNLIRAFLVFILAYSTTAQSILRPATAFVGTNILDKTNAAGVRTGIGAVYVGGDTLLGPLGMVGGTNTGGWTNTGLFYVGGDLMLITTNVAAELARLATNSSAMPFVQTNIENQTSAPPIMQNLSGVRYVETISALPAENGTNGPTVCMTAGFTAPGDGGGQAWLYRATLPAWATVTNLLVVTNVGGGYWASAAAIAGGKLDVRWFGAKPDDNVDDTAAINAALAFSTAIQTGAGHAWEVYIPSGDWTINNASLTVNNAITSNYGVVISGDGDSTVLHSTNDTAFVMLNVGTTEPPTFFSIRDVLFMGRGTTYVGTYYKPLSDDDLTTGLVGMKLRTTYAKVQNITGLYLSTMLWVSPGGRQINGRYTGLHAEICYNGVYVDTNNSGEYSLFAQSIKNGFWFNGGGLNRIFSSSVESAQFGLRAFGSSGLVIDSSHFEGCTNASVWLDHTFNTTINNTKLLTAANLTTVADFKGQVVMTNSSHGLTINGGWFQPEYIVAQNKLGDMVYLTSDCSGFRHSGPAYSFDRFEGVAYDSPLIQDTRTANKISLFTRNNNAIPDGGFEAGTNYWLVSDLTAAEGAVTFDNEFVKEGKRSAHFTVGATFGAGNDFYLFTQNDTTTLTNAYESCLLSGWLKVNSQTMIDRLKFRFFVNGTWSGDGTTVISASGTAPFYSTNWTFFSASFTPARSVTNVFMQVYSSGTLTAGDDLYIDNLTLVPAYSADIGAVSRGEVYDWKPVVNEFAWLKSGGPDLINSAGVPILPLWNGSAWTTGSTNAQYTPALRFPVDGEDNIGNLTNYVTPSLTGNEKAWTGQSYDSSAKLWQAVSVALSSPSTNGWTTVSGAATAVEYTSVAMISTNNTTGVYLGFNVLTPIVIGTEYTFQGYAVAEAPTTLTMQTLPARFTNFVWHTPNVVGTTPTFFRFSCTAAWVTSMQILRSDANAGTDFLIVSNLQYTVGGYFGPADGIRIVASALDTTKAWRQVGPGTYSTKAITAASDWIYADAENIVLIPTGATDLTTALPTILAGAFVGQTVDITSSSADAVTFNDNGSVAGTLLELGAATRAIATNDVLRLKYNGTSWVEAGFWNN